VNFLGAPDGCNRAYVYNYIDKTGVFDDLPLVYSASVANLSVSMTYATTTSLYSTTGGSYLDQEDGYKRTPVYVGDANTTYNLTTSLYALDLFGTGSTVAFPVDTNATKPRYLERFGIDLDSLNFGPSRIQGRIVHLSAGPLRYWRTASYDLCGLYGLLQ